MPENFITPVGLSSDGGTWNFTVDEDGNLAIRSNSPAGGGEIRILLNDDTGRVGIGTSDNPAMLDITGEAIARDVNGTIRVHLSSIEQRIEVMNSDGEIIGMLGGAAKLRLGTNGENGDILLYHEDAQDIFNNGDATVRLSSSDGDFDLGGNGRNGDVFLRDSGGQQRVRLRSASQRLEVLNDNGEIIGMLGGGGNIRAGTNGENGDLFLYHSQSGNIFDNEAATVRLSANTGDMTLGGNDRNGDIFLRDRSGTNRVRIRASSQRLEVLNAAGDIIGMIGGSGNIRAGSNGENGDLFLYHQGADDIFDNGNAVVQLSASDGRITLGGSGRDGRVEIRDESGVTTIVINGETGNMGLGATSGGNPGGLFVKDRSGSDVFVVNGSNGNANLGRLDNAGRFTLRDEENSETIVLNGAAANLGLGARGVAGDLFVKNDAGQNTIHLSGNTGNVNLEGDVRFSANVADCAEEFDLLSPGSGEPGTVLIINDNGRLSPADRSYDPRVAGIVSGAGDLRPGIVLGSQGTEDQDRCLLAVVGRVYCKVDASYAPVSVGDMLTTSPTPGHAMRATDRALAPGSVIGKALGSIDRGKGLVQMLVSLQ